MIASKALRSHACCVVRGWSLAACLCGPLYSTLVMRGQAVPTAERRIALSVFAGPTGTYTGLQSGRNVAITAALDINVLPFHGFYPTAEIRGSYPIVNGVLDDQRNVLGGPKLSRKYGIFHPYVDLLAGRGQIRYHNGYPSRVPGLYYLQSVSNVFSSGGGCALDLLGSFRVISDLQILRYSTPVTESGHIYAKALTFGLEYRIR